MSARPSRRPNQCNYCTSRRCYTRAVTECGTFDELSCLRHESRLRWDAFHSGHVNPILFKHSTDPMRRGEPSADVAFERFRAELADLQAEAKDSAPLQSVNGGPFEQEWPS